MKLSDWMSSIADAGRDILSGERKWFSQEQSDQDNIESLCEQLLSSRGEALGTALACLVVDACQQMDPAARFEFFQLLLNKFSPRKDAIDEAIAAYQRRPNSESLRAIHRCTEAPRQELFRRINMAPGGTKVLVQLRAELLLLLKEHPRFSDINDDLQHLMTSWFNRGFLKLVKIDWHSPAGILEKLMEYEAVHAMSGWDDLRRRLAEDRRCFAFFHPAMDDEPLIFVQVALTQGIAGSVQGLLNSQIDPLAEKAADSAIFYSISDCQKGLKGISFGNFLIKQVVMELQKELPNLKQFATLSPIPGFCSWLNQKVANKELSADQLAAIAGFDEADRPKLLTEHPLKEEVLMQLCAEYLYKAKRYKKPLDPVARFHLRNGASIERLNWAGDVSNKGIRQSAGIMVNYRYDLSRVPGRHERYVNDHAVSIKKDFTKVLESSKTGLAKADQP